MTNIILYLLLGLVTGTFSGLIGIGGGTIIVPALVFFIWLVPTSGPRHHVGIARTTDWPSGRLDIL